MRYTEIDERLARLAAKQYWLFNRRQACERGASERMIERRLAEEAWIHPESAVYGLAGYPMTWRRRLKACELGTPDSAVAGFAGAGLHRLLGYGQARAELAAPPGTSSRGKLAVIHREAGFKTTTVDGIRVTTIAQTLFDIAHRTGVWKLEPAMDQAIVDTRLTVAELEERLEFYKGSRRHGLARIRPLILERGADAWEPPVGEMDRLLEKLLGKLHHRIDWVREAPAPWRPATQRVDRFAPGPGIILEGDGRRWHTRVLDFDRDRWRDNKAAALGLRVVRFTYVHLTEWMDECAELLDAAIVAKHRAA